MHAPLLADRTPGAWLPRGHRGRLTVYSGFLGMGLTDLPQQRATLREFLLAHTIRQKAEVPQPVKAVRRDVQHQTSQKLHRIERQGA